MEVRPISQVFLTGKPTVVPVGGRYFRVTGNVNPFTLDIGRDGQYIATIPNAIAGDSGECGDKEPSFDALRITTTGDEAVSILVTDGTIRRDSQNSDVSDRAGRLLGVISGIVSGALGPLAQLALGGVNALQTTERGAAYGSSYVSSSNITGGATSQVFSPATNVNGAIVWVASLASRAATDQYVSLLAKVGAAPTGQTDGDGLLVAGATGTAVVSADLSHPMFIAAGKGLWFYVVATETLGHRRVLYTIL